MAVHSYDDLIAHHGHRLWVTAYGSVNVAVECEDCYEILIDFDREED